MMQQVAAAGSARTRPLRPEDRPMRPREAPDEYHSRIIREIVAESRQSRKAETIRADGAAPGTAQAISLPDGRVGHEKRKAEGTVEGDDEPQKAPRLDAIDDMGFDVVTEYVIHVGRLRGHEDHGGDKDEVVAGVGQEPGVSKGFRRMQVVQAYGEESSSESDVDTAMDVSLLGKASACVPWGGPRVYCGRASARVPAVGGDGAPLSRAPWSWRPSGC